MHLGILHLQDQHPQGRGPTRAQDQCSEGRASPDPDPSPARTPLHTGNPSSPTRSPPNPGPAETPFPAGQDPPPQELLPRTPSLPIRTPTPPLQGPHPSHDHLSLPTTPPLAPEDPSRPRPPSHARAVQAVELGAARQIGVGLLAQQPGSPAGLQIRVDLIQIPTSPLCFRLPGQRVRPVRACAAAAARRHGSRGKGALRRRGRPGLRPGDWATPPVAPLCS